MLAFQNVPTNFDVELVPPPTNSLISSIFAAAGPSFRYILESTLDNFFTEYRADPSMLDDGLRWVKFTPVQGERVETDTEIYVLVKNYEVTEQTFTDMLKSNSDLFFRAVIAFRADRWTTGIERSYFTPIREDAAAFLEWMKSFLPDEKVLPSTNPVLKHLRRKKEEELTEECIPYHQFNELTQPWIRRLDVTNTTHIGTIMLVVSNRLTHVNATFQRENSEIVLTYPGKDKATADWVNLAFVINGKTTCEFKIHYA